MVGLHWQGTGTPLFRTRSLSGRWSAWLAADDDWGRDGSGWRKGAAEWTGAADAIQYRLRGRVTALRAYFLWSPVERIPARRLSIAGSPTIIPRESWGADESIRRDKRPVYAPALRFVLIHHTVNTNNYTPAESAAIVRGDYVYHVKGNGWDDIGYNFLVDKYGQVFEGRYGGIDKAVVGAHSLGFNKGSAGDRPDRQLQLGRHLGGRARVARQAARLAAGRGAHRSALVRERALGRQPEVSARDPREPARDLGSPRHVLHRVPGQRPLRRDPVDRPGRRSDRRAEAVRAPRAGQGREAPPLHREAVGVASVERHGRGQEGRERGERQQARAPRSPGPTTRARPRRGATRGRSRRARRCGPRPGRSR